ncbi:MAG: carbohydrate-binding protein [Gammaproteobacteria bacterium]|nr:carbohydrate-binding protein [Gammaproteobacteria bacterium]
MLASLPSAAFANPYIQFNNFIPGIVEAERFEDGGEGAAYHDLTPTNEPGAFRPGGVDIEQTSDVGGGYDIGWVKPGEWLNYSVMAHVDGRFSIGVRYAAQGDGGKMHIELDGVNITGTLNLTDTGGWQKWKTLWVHNIPITTSANSMRLVFDSGNTQGWLANINYVEFRNPNDPYVPYSGHIPLVPARVQAENFTRGGEGISYHDSTRRNEPGQYRVNEGVDIEQTTDAGGGYDVGWVTPGEWLQYIVRPTRFGSVTAKIRYAAKGFGGIMHIEQGGVDISGPIQLPDTGGWQTWRTVETKPMTGPWGPMHPDYPHEFRLVFDSGNPEGWLANINWVQFNDARDSYQGGDHFPYLQGQHEAEHFDWGGEGVAYHDTTEANEPAGFRIAEGPDIEFTSDEGGGFDITGIKPGEWLEYTKLVFPTNNYAGIYTFEIRYASLGDGGTMHIEFDRADKTGPIQLTNTGGWQTWKTITIRDVHLPAGAEKMRLAFDRGNTQGRLANINWVRITEQ